MNLHFLRYFAAASGLLAFLFLPSNCAAQNASLTGVVKDPQGAVVPIAAVTLTDIGKHTAVKTITSSAGTYEFPILQPGEYELKAEAPGFQASIVSPIPLAVDERGRADVLLSLSGSASSVQVTAEGVGAVETESSAIGDVIASKTITDIPLNGRFYLDLAVMTPGSVVSSTSSRSSSTQEAAFGAFSINSSGARSDSASFLVDGIDMNDGTQIAFQPSVEAIQEFKAQSSSFSAEYGRTAGIIVNGVTRSGTNALHGTGFEFLRNQKLDALNYFDPPRAVEEARTGEPIAPFHRNIFGESVGGPVLIPKLYDGRNKTFFFENYEGRRLNETETFTTTVPTAAQRAAVTNPVVAQLLTFIPLPNNAGVAVNNYTGQSPRYFVLDNTTVRGDHLIDSNNTLFVSTMIQIDHRLEASDQGYHNIPLFGDFRPGHRYFISLGYTHIFSPSLTGELRAGGNRVTLFIFPQASYLDGLTPANFGIVGGTGGVDPDIRISGGPEFGGISGEPSGRSDLTFQTSYMLNWFKGKNAIKWGAEYRVFYANTYNDGTGGLINFSSLANFLAGIPSTTNLRVGDTTPAMVLRTTSGFMQDDYKVLPNLTLNLGLRYEFNAVPTARHDYYSIFDFATNQLQAANGAQPYRPDYLDFSPRIGLSWDPFGKAKTVIRAAAGVYYDDPLLSVATAEASNPPYSTAYTYNYSGISLLNPFAPGSTSALSPSIVSPNFKGPRSVQWNFNIQQHAWNTIFQIGYIGSSGNRLPISLDYNQGINGVRPLTQYGSIGIEESVGRSSYEALWISANRKLSRGLTFDASYTFSKCIDTASTSGSAGIQNAYNLNAEKGLCDFNAAGRIVASVLYQIPNTSHLKILTNRWAISTVANYQSGNPFNPVVSSLRSGSSDANDRPDYVSGQSVSVANPGPSEWFNTAAFVLNPLGTFGNVGRNVLTGPPFRDVDVSLLKNFPVRERVALQFRASCYNISNTPNFGQPGNIVGTSSFGVISSTRSQAGDFGSSREFEFALKLVF